MYGSYQRHIAEVGAAQARAEAERKQALLDAYNRKVPCKGKFYLLVNQASETPVYVAGGDFGKTTDNPRMAAFFDTEEEAAAAREYAEQFIPQQLVLCQATKDLT
jgi:hypothetical protein